MGAMCHRLQETAASTILYVLTWLISGGVTNLGECRQATQSQQDGQAEEDDGIQPNPNSVHDDVIEVTK
jgi:hypothetical protein